MMDVYVKELDEVGRPTGRFISATYEQVKAVHPKCGTCAWHEGYRHHWWASKPDATAHRCNSRAFTIAHKSNLDPAADYCRHHQPKEPTA